MDRTRAAKVQTEAAGPFTDQLFASTYPRLLEHMRDGKWGDGKSRETSTLTVIIEGPTFKVCLNNREESVNAWASGATLEDALLAIEMALQDGTIEWRRPGWMKKGR